MIGRVEKGADLRLGTLRKLYSAMGCRLLLLPAGASFEMDWEEAISEDEHINWRIKHARVLEKIDYEGMISRLTI